MLRTKGERNKKWKTQTFLYPSQKLHPHITIQTSFSNLFCTRLPGITLPYPTVYGFSCDLFDSKKKRRRKKVSPSLSHSFRSVLLHIWGCFKLLFARSAVFLWAVFPFINSPLLSGLLSPICSVALQRPILSFFFSQLSWTGTRMEETWHCRIRQ